MGLKLIKKFRWFAFAVSMSAFLFCADQVNAQTIQQDDMHVLRARSETGTFQKITRLRCCALLWTAWPRKSDVHCSSSLPAHLTTVLITSCWLADQRLCRVLPRQ